MPPPARVLLVRLSALATLSGPAVAGVLFLATGPAQAASSPFMITCPQSDGSAGGAAVTGPGQQCGTFTDAAPTVISASCQPLLCGGTPSFVVTSPSGSTLHTAQLGGIGHPSTSTYTVPAGSPDGSYTATLSGGGANVSASFALQSPPATTSPTPTATTSSPSSGAPSTEPTVAPSTGASASGTPSATSSSGAPATAGTAPSSGPGATGGGRKATARFPLLPPPAGIAQLPPLPKLPMQRDDGVPGPYGKTLPYDGSVTVGQKAGKPTVLSHVADTFDNKQVAESIAAACLALLFAAHLRRFTRRPSADADL